LKAMNILSEFNPRLIGSVWRGTARRGSDIDVVVYSSRLKAVKKCLTEAGYIINGMREVPASVNHLTKRSHHITVGLNEYDLEVVVRRPHEMEEEERCEIYGDPKRGLDLRELEKVMKLDPLRKFVPWRRMG
jgi:predicted nucleotidyltransferase